MLVAGIVSVIALAYYYRQDAILLYGDAVAHINIARRVFDSRWPGPGQLGTVWLPLPHVLMMPFIISDWAWQTGLGGSIPSMVAYVAGVAGCFRLLWRGLLAIGATTKRARLAAWFGVVVFGANPNLLYMQSTAMNEPLYIAFVIWATVFLADFAFLVRREKQPNSFSHLGAAAAGHPLDDAERGADAESSLRRCGVMLMCAMLCRYDGWFIAAWFGAAAMWIVLSLGMSNGWRSLAPNLQKALVTFVVLLAIAPAFWLGWNQFYFDNPLEWMNGPYSARAIMERSMQGGQPPHPGYHDVGTAIFYYIKCAKLNLAGWLPEVGGAQTTGWRFIENAWAVLPVLGTLVLLLFARRLWPLLLLWVPLPFYGLSIAYGGVPIFMPVWWPFSYYNVRYGLHLLPTAAVFTAILLYFLLSFFNRKPVKAAITVLALAFVVVSYAGIWKSGPVCLREARENSTVRIALEQRVGQALKQLPPNSTFLMQIGYYVGVLQRAGIPLKRTINESDFVVWNEALADPAARVDYLVAADDDQVARTARRVPSKFEPMATFEAPGQPTVTIYRKR